MEKEKEPFSEEIKEQVPESYRTASITVSRSSGEDCLKNTGLEKDDIENPPASGGANPGTANAGNDVPFHEEEALPVMQLRDLVPANVDWVKHTKVVLTLVSVAALLILGGIVLGTYIWDYGLIADGLTVNGVAIGHLSLTQARSKLQQDSQAFLRRRVRFIAADKEADISLSDLGLSLNLNEALQKAYSVGRTGLLPEKVLAKLRASTGLNLVFPAVWDEQRLSATLTAKLAFLNQPSRAASYKMENNTMVISPEKAGQAVDFAALREDVMKLDLTKLPPQKVPVRQITPTLTAAQLENLKPTGLIAKYSTSFDPSQINRTHNLTLATQTLDGILLKPEESFSFNDQVGPRTAEAGYRDAIIIENGQFVTGLGGGVCQVSTTLYNAVLLADLPVTERANHALAVAYAPLGQDATVAYGSLDLRFRNDSEGYLLLRSQVNGNTLTFSLYGKTIPGKTVAIADHVQAVYPPTEKRIADYSLSPGATQVEQAGQPGYAVATTRTVKMNGRIVKTETLPSSHYQSLPRIIAAGPAR